MNDSILNSPVDQRVLDYFIAPFLTMTTAVCFLSNSFLIMTFMRYKDLITPLNVFIVAITLSNLVGTLQFPFVIKSSLDHRLFLFLYLNEPFFHF